MKRIVCLMLIGVSLRAFSQERPMHVYQIDALSKVLKERVYFKNETDTLRVARGETASAQFVIRANRDLKDLDARVVHITDGRAVIDQVSTGWVGYVKVGRHYNKPSKDILHSASGYFPDPIFTDTTMDLDQGDIQPLWVSVKIPLNIPAGLYQGKVEIFAHVQGKRLSSTKELYIRVYPVSVPKTSLWITNWMSFGPGNLAYMNHGKDVEAFSPLYWQLLKQFARMAGSHGQNMYRIYPVWLTRYRIEGGKYHFDFSHFDQEVELFSKEGNLQRIEGGHLAWRSGKWTDPYFVEVPVKEKRPGDHNAPGEALVTQKDGMHFVKLAVSDPRVDNFLSQFLPALREHLKNKGWLDKYIQHVGDEPVDANADSYKKISGYVHRYMPGVKVVDAVTASRSLGGSIDIWCPVLDLFKKDYAYFDSLRQRGNELWFYTCVIPQGNYANRFIELPLVQTRLLHWIDYKYHASGYLHWGFNFWSGFDDPLQETARHRGMLPGGDCFIVYPGYHKLYSSIRLEAMRDGVYDYELLRMLQQKNAGKASDIASSVVLNIDEYDSEVQHFRKMRKQLLEALSQ